VVVLGAGFGGLETAFYLRMLVGKKARISLVSDRRCFLFKPNSIYVPFGLDPGKLRVPLDGAARKGIDLHLGRASEVDTESRRVQVDGTAIPYDFLVVATGAGMRADEVPGLAENALSTWTPIDMLRLRVGFESLVEAAERNERRRALPHPTQQQVRRPALRDRLDAGQLAAAQGAARLDRDHVVDIRDQLHPGLRAAPA